MDYLKVFGWMFNGSFIGTSPFYVCNIAKFQHLVGWFYEREVRLTYIMKNIPVFKGLKPKVTR